MKNRVLSLLSDNEYISGEVISENLGISRAAVWKHINSLKNDGYIIESSTNKGYIIVQRPDILNFEEVKPYLNTAYIGRNFVHFDSTDSTSTKAKELAREGCQNGLVVVSEEQTSGRGRLGRSWISPKGKGIWMSIVLRPDIQPVEAYKVTIIAAAAVHRALLDCGVSSLIKWPNDIVINSKKICGILTEMNAELSKVHYLIIGIGININTSPDEIPEDLKEKASSLRIEENRLFNRKIILSSILNHFEKLYEEFINNGSVQSSIKICKDNSAVLGKEILLIQGNKTSKVKVLDINDNGHLIVEDNGLCKEIISGEVSIRATTGYI